LARDDSSTHRQMRLRIAQLAARIMAEDGIDDVGLAKRKAARQAGAPETRNLPDNDQVESALREYLQIYRADEQDERIDRLRRDALELMAMLEQFDPHLVGPVLSGSASKHAEIDLQLFTDNPKDLALFLINRDIEFSTRESRFWVGSGARSVSVYEIDAATRARPDCRLRRARHPASDPHDAGGASDGTGPCSLRAATSRRDET
jgi:hypothetical protein